MGYRTNNYGRGQALHGDKTTTGATVLTWGQFGYRKLLYYKGFPEQSTPVFNFCLFINERQGIRLRYYKRSC
ncbi:hypothetical protein FC759_25865 [Citrobacter freundii]|nr:hypothetical protein E0E99_25915 [Citrobacter freundii]TKI72152.1 hypothetical protein FC759_25865 [Citrobacter freundii]